MKDISFIYSLSDPKTKLIRYIGRTQVSLQERLYSHIKKRNSNNSHKNNWIKSLVKENLRPIINFIAEVPSREQDYWEDYYIDLYRNKGFDLTNSAKAQKGNGRHSEETKLKISNSLKGKKQSEETKQKRADTLKEVYKNPELRKLKSEQTLKLQSEGKCLGIKIKNKIKNDK